MNYRIGLTRITGYAFTIRLRGTPREATMPATLLPTESYSITIRVEIQSKPGMLGKVTTSIGDAGGDIGAVDLSGVGKGTVTRDITVSTRGVENAQEIIRAVQKVTGVKIINVSDRTFLKHIGGKIEISGKISVKTREDLSMAYTPGVVRVPLPGGPPPRSPGVE